MKRIAYIAMVGLAACQEPISSATNSTAQLGSPVSAYESSDDAVIYQKILEKKATFDEILTVFSASNKNVLSNNINALRRYHSDERVIAVLLSIWRDHTKEHPDFSWDLLRADSVRVSVAFALHELDKKRADEYIRHIRGQIDRDDPEAQSLAAMSLGIIGTDEDIPILKGLIVNGDIVVAGSAASALGMMRSSESIATLKELVHGDEIDANKKRVVGQVFNNVSR